MPELATELKRSHEELGKTVHAFTEELNKLKEGDTERKSKVDELNKRISEWQTDIDSKLAELKRQRIIGTSKDVQRELSPEQQLQMAGFAKYLRYGEKKASLTPEEQRALSDAFDSDGGFLSPQAFESTIIMGAYDMASLRPLCQVGQTSRSSVEIPKLSKPTFVWGQAGVAVSEQDLSAGLARIQINELTGLYLIANTTLEDTDANIVAELTGAFSTGIAEMEDDAFAAGDGNQKPLGVVADAAVQANARNSGVAAAISDASNPAWINLTFLMAIPRAQYARRGTFAMNRTIEAKLRVEVDDQGRPIWAMPISATAPATIWGRPIAIAEAMPAEAANSFPVVFGDFANYRIRDRPGVVVQRLAERYAEYRQTGFLITKRVGGQATLAEAFAVLKCST